MNAVEQVTLYGVTVVVLVGTLILFVGQFVRDNRKNRD